MPNCRYPHKHSYNNEDDARDAVEEIRDRVFSRGQRFVPLYPYLCPGGRDHWHLSSARQGRATCPQCEVGDLPSWFDGRRNEWVIYAHGDCPIQAGTKGVANV
jgi:hypothetical protein